MTSEMTEVRDEARRAAAMSEFLLQIRRYLRGFDTDAAGAVHAYQYVDVVLPGSSDERLPSRGLTQWLAKLKASDPEAWVTLLLLAALADQRDYNRLRQLSPFGDALLYLVNFRRYARGLLGGSGITGDLEPWLRRVINEDGIQEHTGLDNNWVAVILRAQDGRLTPEIIRIPDPAKPRRRR